LETIKNKNILIAVVTGQNFLNILYWFEERRSTTDNGGQLSITTKDFFYSLLI